MTDDHDTPRGLPLFASVVAHELRNPLSAVKIALQTVERQPAIPPNDAMRLRIALREVAAIERVLNQVVVWAHPPEPVPQTVAVSTLLALARSGETDSARIDLGHLTDLGDVRVDPTVLAPALAQLLRNALEASPASERVSLSAQRRDGAVMIVVDSRGTLSQEDCARAFEPFFTTKARGIGLGLPLARLAARAHGGDVTLEQRPQGARAILTIPAVDG